MNETGLGGHRTYHGLQRLLKLIGQDHIGYRPALPAHHVVMVPGKPVGDFVPRDPTRMVWRHYPSLMEDGQGAVDGRQRHTFEKSMDLGRSQGSVGTAEEANHRSTTRSQAFAASGEALGHLSLGVGRLRSHALQVTFLVRT